MKLKKVPVKVNKDFEDMYHTCRWCHYYQEGKCYNNQIQEIDNIAVYSVSESGKLGAVIEETIESVKKTSFKELEYLLSDWGVSQKRIKEFGEKFKECFNDYNTDLKEWLDEKVSECYQTELDGRNFDGLEISNPEEYYCKDWC